MIQVHRAANHGALGIIYRAQVDRIMLLSPRWNHYANKWIEINIKMVIFMPVCESGRGGRGPICNQHPLVAVPLPISFCSLKKRANRTTWFIFPHFIPHFLPRHFLAKCSFHFSFRWQQPCIRGRQILYNRLSERNIGQIAMFRPGCTIIQWCNVFSFEFSVIHVGMYDVDSCSVHFTEQVHYA